MLFGLRFCAFLLKRIQYIGAKRYYSTIVNQNVRVRFAPSPTGYLHLGGLRTALYNYLFARANKGSFILRIEDTDQTRLIEGATEQLSKDLEWAGIIPNEGPFQGGSFGPYIQSQRLEIYREEVKKLLENGTAYYCFCTERRLELLRKEAVKARQIPKYDNRCRHMTPVQIAEKLANHDPFCIRFKLGSEITTFNDLIYGKINLDITDNEGDPVIIKSDGYPTYHFANVVDDHLMGISHVLRGVEWQISTTKHLLLYKAFQWEPPEFGHLPLLTNSDGSKLSKRQGDIRVEFYRDNGIFSNALINYITLTGGGFNREGTTKPFIYSMNELQDQFNVKKINAHSSRLNSDMLRDCNRIELMNQINDQKECKKLIIKMRSLIKLRYPKESEYLDLKDDHISNILKVMAPRIYSLNELIEEKYSFLWILPHITNDENLESEMLESLIKDLENQDFTKANIQSLLKDFSVRNKLTFSNFMKSLRSLLSGLREGPGVAEMMEILGKDSTIARFRIKNKKNK